MRRLSASLLFAVFSPVYAFNLPGLPKLPSLPALPQLPQVPPMSSLPNFPPLPQLPPLGNAGAVPAAVPDPADQGATPPDYSQITNLFNFPDIRLETLPKGRVPYLTVNNVEALKTYQQNAPLCRSDKMDNKAVDASKCPQYEWSVPYSAEADSQAVARDLRQAWQRFEDRYYWRAMLELNNPGLLVTNCIVDLGTGLRPTTPEVKVHVPEGSFPSPLQGKLESGRPNPQMNLDSYFPLPQVPNTDYCGNTSPSLTIMFLPGACTYAGSVRLFCIEGSTRSLNPLAPNPLIFNMAAAQNRVVTAIKAAHSSYLADYQTDVLNALFNPKDHKLFFPLPWRSLVPGDGAVIAPVANTSISLTPLNDLAQTAKSKLGGLIGNNAYPYYFQWAYRSPTLGLNTLPSRHEALGTPPGLWPLEEFKRALPPTSLPLQERLGYSSFFEAWNELRAVMLPEPLLAKAARPITYMAFGNNIYLHLFAVPTIVPIPAPVPIPPYFGLGLPFVGPQMQFDWVSVPEGYAIPRVVGRPLYDYAPLLR